MSDKYFTVNIRAYLDKDEPTYIGEESLYDLLSDFSCPKNPDVEYFLLHNAIEFTKKDQSITYLVFDAEDASLVGYFSLTVKPISVRASHISKTMAKKLSRVSILDEETQSYTTAAYLIAQLGKNYSLPKNKRIPGNILLGFALETISSLKYSVGGVMEFLECEDNEFLLSFYTQNHFKPFDTRITASQNNEPHTLHQLLKMHEKKRQSDLHFVFQETAASFSSLFCFSSSNSRRTSSPYLSIIRTRKSMHRSNSIFCCISSSRYCFDLSLFYRACWKTTLNRN